MRIIIDTREQTPWSFPATVETARGTLQAGDYALAGDTWAIERKSLDDFLGTVSTGWERFQRELDRMPWEAAKVVIVEGEFGQCCFRSGVAGEIVGPSHNHPMLSPSFVASRVAELTMAGVSVLFAGDPGQAAALAYHLLRRRELEIIPDAN
jgi:ERCC4-type nuclease